MTRQKVAAAKQFIENHYKSQMKSLQERKERCEDPVDKLFIFLLSVFALRVFVWLFFSRIRFIAAALMTLLVAAHVLLFCLHVGLMS
jgi:hypothetical protein